MEAIVKNLTTKEMISIFPLWTFHLYVATFQQQLHLEYVSRSCGSYDEFLDRGFAANKEATEPRVSIDLSHHFESFTVAIMTWVTGTWSTRVPNDLGYVTWSTCVPNDLGYVPFVVITIRSFPHSWPITRLVTRKHDRCYRWSRNCPSFRRTWVHPRCLVRFVLLDL